MLKNLLVHKSIRNAGASLPLLLVLLALISGCSAPRKLSQTTAPLIATDSISGTRALSDTLETLLADPLLAPAITGIAVENLTRRQPVFARNAGKLFHPASNMKLFTAAAALKTLGPEYTFHTVLATDTSSAVSDTLAGDLYFIGGGDPAFDIGGLAELISQIYSLGIRHIAGDIVLDDSRLDNLAYGEGWMWDDQPYSYAAPLSALSIEGNLLEVTVTDGDSAGAPAKVRLHPETSYLEIRNRSAMVDTATYAAMEADSLIDFEPLKVMRRWQSQENILEIDGMKVAGSGEIRVRRNIVDAPDYAGTLLLEHAQRSGITVAGELRRGSAPDTTRALASHKSAQMATLAAEMNKPSDNLYAELIMKTVGAEATGEPGSIKTGFDVLRELLTGWGADTDAFRFADGSGVSPYTLVSPDLVLTLLREMYQDFTVRNEFLASLPIAGVDGTLENRMRDTAAYRIVRAKTGTISAVTTLGGYTTARNGDILGFSIMMQHFVGSANPLRRIQDRICDALTRYAPTATSDGTRETAVARPEAKGR